RIAAETLRRAQLPVLDRLSLGSHYVATTNEEPTAREDYRRPATEERSDSDRALREGTARDVRGYRERRARRDAAAVFGPRHRGDGTRARGSRAERDRAARGLSGRRLADDC